jgi:hypothetical protein
MPSEMDFRRVCVHEAGHFYVAFLYRPIRAVSIQISRLRQTDALTGEGYTSMGRAVTFHPYEGPSRVDVSIRAAGLAAESITYGDSFEDLMRNPDVRFAIKTDTDNAKSDLRRAGFGEITDTMGFVELFFRPGFDDAVVLLRSSQERLNRIVDYCLANLGREIQREEIVEACRL